MKLVIWRILKTDDAECYSIISKTKKGALEQYKQNSAGFDFELEQIEFEFESSFDLFDFATTEFGGRGTYLNSKILSSYHIKVPDLNGLIEVKKIK
jgi:hypothetical protein